MANDYRRSFRSEPRRARTGIPFGAKVAVAALVTGIGTWHMAPVVEAALTRPAPAAEDGAAQDESSVYYPGCNAARAAGVAPLYRGSPGYRAGMDGDGDGIACENYGGSGGGGGWLSRRGGRPAGRVSSGWRRRAR